MSILQSFNVLNCMDIESVSFQYKIINLNMFYTARC